MSFIFVGLGGGIGAYARYLLTKLFNQIMPLFPYGTLFSNVIAALLIGFIIGMERQTTALPDQVKLFLTTGLLGGLSTFSAFSIETIDLIEKKSYILAGGNILLNVGLSLFCVLIGLAAAKLLAALI